MLKMYYLVSWVFLVSEVRVRIFMGMKTFWIVNCNEITIFAHKKTRNTSNIEYIRRYQFGIKQETKWRMTETQIVRLLDSYQFQLFWNRNSYVTKWFELICCLEICLYTVHCILHMNKHWVDLIWIWCKTIFAFGKQTNENNTW